MIGSTSGYLSLNWRGIKEVSDHAMTREELQVRDPTKHFPSWYQNDIYQPSLLRNQFLSPHPPMLRQGSLLRDRDSGLSDWATPAWATAKETAKETRLRPDHYSKRVRVRISWSWRNHWWTLVIVCMGGDMELDRWSRRGRNTWLANVWGSTDWLMNFDCCVITQKNQNVHLL